MHTYWAIRVIFDFSLCEHLRPGSVSSPPSSPTVSPTISLSESVCLPNATASYFLHCVVLTNKSVESLGQLCEFSDKYKNKTYTFPQTREDLEDVHFDTLVILF